MRAANSAAAIYGEYTMKRKEAIKLDLKKYNTGKFCSKGHKSPRYTSSGVCVACNHARLKAWVLSGGSGS